MLPKPVALFFHPDKRYIEGQIIALTPRMSDEGIQKSWWSHKHWKADLGEPPPIDRHWDWNELAIDYEGTELPSLKVALVASGPETIEGAAMISTESVPSLLTPGKRALLLELLFTAPWNRKKLRKDGMPYVVGVGTELLTWASWLSREKGCEGRLLLDSSPDEVGWYLDAKRGLLRLDKEPIVHEGIKYTPMELPAVAAQLLLEEWD